MSRQFRSYSEPAYSYDEMLGFSTGRDIEELPALEAVVCRATVHGQRERLWLRRGEVWRLWNDALDEDLQDLYDPDDSDEPDEPDDWRLHVEPASGVVAWIKNQLAGSLDRLDAPENTPDYAIDPQFVDQDLAAQNDFERIALSAIYERWYEPEDVDAWIRHQISEVRLDQKDPGAELEPHEFHGELRRLEALRGRALREAYGDDAKAIGRVARALGCPAREATRLLGLPEQYRQWVLERAALARPPERVYRPSGQTGAPDGRAARLMTAACRGRTVVPERGCPQPLPPELAPWHMYVEGTGHCIAVAYHDTFRPGQAAESYMVMAPVELVLRTSRWTIDGVVVATGTGTRPAGADL